jgi:hypothetical protein
MALIGSLPGLIASAARCTKTRGGAVSDFTAPGRR